MNNKYKIWIWLAAWCKIILTFYIYYCILYYPEPKKKKPKKTASTTEIINIRWEYLINRIIRVRWEYVKPFNWA